jgi:hypothetical protein
MSLIDADFATFDLQANGGHFAFSQGNAIIEPQVAATDAHRAVRSTAPARAGATSTVEFIYWSPDGSNPSVAPVAGVPPYTFGIGNGNTTLNDWVGFDANAWGLSGEGKLYNNNGVVATYPPLANGDKVTMTVDMRDVSAPTLTIKNNGRLLDTITLPANASYWYFATISGDPGTRALYGNSGVTPQYYGIGDNGWFLLIDRPAPILLADAPYMTAATDSPRHEKYAGDLDSLSRPMSTSDGTRFWMDGPSAPAELSQGGGLVQMQINDPLADEDNPNQYAELADDSARGAPVYTGRVEYDGAIATMEAHYAGVLDHAEPDSLKTMQVYVRGMEATLATPLRRTLFAPSEANQQIRLLFLPISEGPCRNYKGTSIGNQRFVLNDGAISGFGVVRANFGIPQVYGADFTITPDGSGATFSQETTGEPTFETTTLGGSFDPAADDYLQAAGDFDTATSNPGPPSADVGYPISAGGVHWHGKSFNPAGNPFQLASSGGHKFIRAYNAADGYAWIYQSTYKLRAGYTYTYAVDVRTIPAFGDNYAPQVAPPAQLAFTWYKTAFGSFRSNQWDAFSLERTGVYTGAFINNTGADQDPVLMFNSNNVVSISEVVEINSIKFVELPPVGQDAALGGPGLTQMVKAFAVKRGPLEDFQVATADTDAIDAATGFIYGKHISENENPTSAEILEEILTSCTGARWGAADWKLRVLRLFKPEDVDDADIAGVLTRSDMLTELTQRPDFAEGLSARAQGGRNYSPYTDADFGTSTLSQIPTITRAQLKSDYQWTVTTSVKLANRYRAALLRDPVKTLLDQQAHGQLFIDHANGPFADERNWYDGTFLMPWGRNYQIGQVWLVEHPVVTGGFQKLLIRGYTGKQTQSDHPSAGLKLWGL